MKMNCERLRHTKNHIFITANSFPSKERKEMNQNTAKRGSLKYKQLRPLMRTSRRWLLSDGGWVAGLEPGPQLLTSRAARLSLPTAVALTLAGQDREAGRPEMRTRPLQPYNWLSSPGCFLCESKVERKKGECSKNRLAIACQWVLKTHFFRSL